MSLKYTNKDNYTYLLLPPWAVNRENETLIFILHV